MRRSIETVRPADAVPRIWALLLRQDGKFTRIDLRTLERRNKTEKSLAVAPDGPVVSLTTHGKRIDSVYLTLESIARRSVLPSRIILWLDDLATFRNRPSSLRRLKDRGVEVQLAANYGPHTKY